MLTYGNKYLRDFKKYYLKVCDWYISLKIITLQVVKDTKEN